MDASLISMFAASTFATGSALAHPGHGTTDPGSLLHYLTEPVHVLPVALVVGIGICAGQIWRAMHRQNHAPTETRKNTRPE